MILVLCEIDDVAALWAASRLKARGLRVEIITAPVLSCALRWDHRITSSGTASVTIDLGDGRRVSSSEPTAVLNRLSFVPTERLDRVGSTDRDYAVQEMNALFLSWLHALPGPMLSRPSPQGLCGSWRHRSVWAALAHRAGLATVTYRQSCKADLHSEWDGGASRGSVSVLVIDQRVVAPLFVPREAAAACLRLAGSAGQSLLGVDFVWGRGGRLEVAAATPLPDLTRGGEPVIDALQEALAA